MAYERIEEFNCVFKKCTAKTRRWFYDGWAITGLNNSQVIDMKNNKPREPFFETDFARRLLEDGKLINKQINSAVLVCPQHRENLKADADRLRAEHRNRHKKLADGCLFCQWEANRGGM